MYIELHSRSAFSFLEGSSLPENLIARCAELNMPAMALLDRDGVYGAARFHMAAKKAGIKAHIGAEVTCNFSPQRHGDTEKASECASREAPSISFSVSPCLWCVPEGRAHLVGGSPTRAMVGWPGSWQAARLGN